MDTRLLSWVALCLLGTDHTEAGVSQSPSYRVTKKGQNVTFGCAPISGHGFLYWYRQTFEQGLEFLTYFQNELASDTSKMPPERFSAERPEGTFSNLKIQGVQQGDSAVYFCASSHSGVQPPPSCSQTSFSLLAAPRDPKDNWTSVALCVEREHRRALQASWL
ncbi:T-cell receptor beta chain V region CTL-L17 [Heterocephalus glaber]|nr:T-cell receptor beta chain V region CTL-L17 [Heterocephalus glaber]